MTNAFVNLAAVLISSKLEACLPPFEVEGSWKGFRFYQTKKVAFGNAVEDNSETSAINTRKHLQSKFNGTEKLEYDKKRYFVVYFPY